MSGNLIGVQRATQNASLHPGTAARYLSADQLVSILNEKGVDADVEALRAKEEADEELKKLRSASGSIQGALLPLLEEESLPSETRVELERVLRSLNTTIAGLPEEEVTESEERVESVEELLGRSGRRRKVRRRN